MNISEDKIAEAVSWVNSRINDFDKFIKSYPTFAEASGIEQQLERFKIIYAALILFENIPPEPAELKNKTPELLPCPFCGHAAKSELDGDGEYSYEMVTCSNPENCAGHEVYVTKKEWSIRADLCAGSKTEMSHEE